MLWQIIGNNLSEGGFAPAWYKETYPSYGNKNHAGSMTNCDLTNPGYIQQGPGLATLTNGTQAGSITTLLKGIEDQAVSSDVTYGTGGNQLAQFSSTAVTTGATFPHTINKATVTGESGEDVAFYKGSVYYAYNHTSSVGSSTTRFDITKSTNTIRYTYDTTGTDPGITALTFPIGAEVVINIANASAANNGTFVVTGVGSNYFEVYNAGGVAENDKTIGAGSLVVNAGDIGFYDGVTTFDDDWGSTVPSGAAALAGNVPHHAIVGSNDVMYISNGRYVCSYDGTTLIPRSLDLPPGYVIQSLAWNSDRLWIAANSSTLTGNNKKVGSIYVWDGTTDSWEAEIKTMGNLGALHVKNGLLFVFHQDLTHTGGYKLSYLSGNNLTDLANFTGSLPAFYQVTDYKDFIIWASSGSIWAFGSGDKDLPTKLFQLADGGYSTVGGVACPFGTPMVASNESSSYKLAQFSGYDVNSAWKSLMFDVTGNGRLSQLDSIRFNFEKLESGARVDVALVNNQGTTLYSDTISYAKLGAVTTVFYPMNGKNLENFRVELSYANGSTSATVKIKNFKAFGRIN